LAVARAAAGHCRIYAALVLTAGIGSTHVVIIAVSTGHAAAEIGCAGARVRCHIASIIGASLGVVALAVGVTTAGQLRVDARTCVAAVARAGIVVVAMLVLSAAARNGRKFTAIRLQIASIRRARNAVIAVGSARTAVGNRWMLTSVGKIVALVGGARHRIVAFAVLSAAARLFRM
jgi:hypothetical protein